ncbi:PQ loop repeat-domain-containing protein [Halteromyces radiatus]|uniref:PQ loop repeat-domain-containing protein n=1 Tax=Halteromyces radiatus TaxID=101107 RepID=UPI00221F99E7|nr:PQ loop repeat-domain-containing protein [Halteromyces radiatus]KAI8096618.1 PQ loop repeat-domain-containing protein [Halteromyces radiatus]
MDSLTMPDHEQWAELFGYASIACWIVVFTPQLYENYTRKNTDGVSISFLLLWIFGDIFNLIGALLEHLMLTVLLLAVYYLFADCLLMGQVIYYRYAYSSTRTFKDILFNTSNNDETIYDTMATASTPDNDENAPLLRPSSSDSSSHTVLSQKQSEHTRWIVRCFFILSVLLWLTLLLGSVLFFWWPGAKDKVDLSQWHLLSQSLGWASAILYCSSRIPQIMQNFRNESVEGLSLTMFVFSVVGNLTYSASIFLKSTDRTYLLINYPWLLGSGGTLFFDFTIFFQFYTYKQHRK